jgi:hypothetical protein
MGEVEAVVKHYFWLEQAAELWFGGSVVIGFFQYNYNGYEYWNDEDVTEDNIKLWHYLVKDGVVYDELDNVLGPYRKPKRVDIEDVIAYIEMKEGMKK